MTFPRKPSFCIARAGCDDCLAYAVRRSLGQDSHLLCFVPRFSQHVGRWMVSTGSPEQDYYSGFLWPRYDRAKQLAEVPEGTR